jgi:hypothetical protein
MFEGPQRANKRLDLIMRVKADALSRSEMTIRIHQENFGSKSGGLRFLSPNGSLTPAPQSIAESPERSAKAPPMSSLVISEIAALEMHVYIIR